MRYLNFKKPIFFFSIFIIFYSIFYLYHKHEVGNDTSISEWLINYSGGFTRRGLGGEINIFISRIFKLNLRDSIFLFQSLIHSSFVVVLFFYFQNLRINILQLFAFFSPLFLIYPIAELEALGRKETLIFLAFIISVFLTDPKFKPSILNYQICFTFPVLCLIWEEVVMFAPYFVVLIIFKNNLKTFKDSFLKSLIIFFPSIITTIYIFMNPLSLSDHKFMCDYLKYEFAERCYMSADLLVKNTIYFDTLHIHDDPKFFPHYFRYLLIFVFGFIFLHLILAKNFFKKKDNFINSNFNPIFLYLLIYIPIIPLFVWGGDWGRWINITYSFSIILYFYFYKNDHISNEFDISNTIFKNLIKKKIILFFLFFLFAFFWNPKTVITGDIATNSLYKIIYKSSKIMFNHEGIRLFENNPIIKFHKIYIE